MNRQKAGALVLVLVAIVIAVYKLRPGDTPPVEIAPADASAPARRAAPHPLPAPPEAPPVISKKTREAPENEELAAEYGEVRTNLAKHVSTNILGLLDEAVALGEMAVEAAAANESGTLPPEVRGAIGPGVDDLQLDESQTMETARLFRDFQRREIATARTSISRVKSQPDALMSVMLAGDAHARGRLSDEALAQVRTDSAEGLQNVVNPLDRRNFSGGDPLQDPEFSRAFRSLLSPGQTAALEASRAAKPQPAAGAAPAGSMQELPSMELEKLDQAVSSGKAVVTGLRQMMEGIGSLQQLVPPPAETPPEP